MNNTLPLLMDSKRVKVELGIGNNSLYALEEQGLLRPVRLGSLRIRRYKTSEVLALAGENFKVVRMSKPPEQADAATADSDTAT